MIIVPFITDRVPDYWNMDIRTILSDAIISDMLEEMDRSILVELRCQAVLPQVRVFQEFELVE